MQSLPRIRITSKTLWTTTNKLASGPAATGRSNEEQMRRSHDLRYDRNLRRPRHLPNAKYCRYNLIQMGPRRSKHRISEISTTWGNTNIFEKNIHNRMRFSFVRVRQLLSMYHVYHCRAGPYTLPCW